MTKVAAQTGIKCEPQSVFKTLKHGVTRFRITLDCYDATYVSGRARGSNGVTIRWIPLAELPALPLSTTGRKLARFIEQHVYVELPTPT
jgi:A/G-specific adenine glycosylase